MIKRYTHTYHDIISIDNLLEAWKEFSKGKKTKPDVLEFEHNLMGNILNLHNSLQTKTYTHGPYHAFKINDPKPRNIHKASVRDRLLHHAIYRQLYPYFDTKFIAHSYSCRQNKGTHRAINQFKKYCNKVSNNNTKTCWILKCDIKRFFDSIDHDILMNILRKYIHDQNILFLLQNIIDSFRVQKDTGLPLGNLTSQLLVNIYMNEFDQHIKHKLKVKHYIRYADDFVIIDSDREYLKQLLPDLTHFLNQDLKLELHPKKVSISTLASGVDFLGWVHFPYHRTLRTATKRRMFKRLKDKHDEAIVRSYMGLLSHGNTKKLIDQILV